MPLQQGCDGARIGALRDSLAGIVVDVASSYGLTCRQAESALLDAGVVANRNSIPLEPNGALYTSGLRFGTPGLTTLDMVFSEMEEIADIVVETLVATRPAQRPAGTSKARHETDAGSPKLERGTLQTCLRATRSIQTSNSEPQMARVRFIGRSRA
jgi:Serine hydroxymethyltransferase